jgi:hypothetical protein
MKFCINIIENLKKIFIFNIKTFRFCGILYNIKDRSLYVYTFLFPSNFRSKNTKNTKIISKNLFNILKIFYKRGRLIWLKKTIIEYPSELKKNILTNFSIKYLRKISKNESINIYIINNIWSKVIFCEYSPTDFISHSENLKKILKRSSLWIKKFIYGH